MSVFVAYGGTFDPVHCGHVAVAVAVSNAFQAGVHLLPAADPPHKDATQADATHRLRMLELAAAGERGLRVDARELRRDGPSYTIDTLQALRRELGADTPLVWVIGADSLSQLHRWHRWRELFDVAHVLAVGRPGFGGIYSLDAGLSTALAPRWQPIGAFATSPAGRVALLPMDPERDESSTEIRARIAAGQPWRHLVPAPVAAYIDRHRLYAAPAAA